MEILGIDVGGSGIKAAPVNIETGELTAKRLRILTPQPSKPGPVAEVVARVVDHFKWSGPVGCGFPAVVRNGVTWSAANVHKKWIGTDASRLFSEATGCPVVVVNDADAAGIAEMLFGAGQGQDGTVLIITIGTGLGSALFRRGVLVPNCEFGHIEIGGKDAEARASDAARKADKLSWQKWGRRFDRYLRTLEALICPDLFILGGGTSASFEKFAPYLTVRAQVVPARFRNEAGIVGAALAARELASQ